MITRLKWNSQEEWLSLRHKHIGGSDASTIVGLNPFRSPFSLWAEKTDKVKPFEGNLTTEVGHFLEEFVARKFEEQTGKTVRKCNLSMVNDLYPWAIANVDRLIVGEDAGLEIKTTSELNMKSFKNGEYPSTYYVQCVHYMAVTGKKRWYLAVLIGNKELKIFVIDRDEDEIAALMKAEKEFWFNYVLTDTPPDVDGSHSTTDSIKSMFPGDASAPIAEIDSDLEQLIDLKVTLGKQKKDLEMQIDEIENRIKVQMGDSQRGICGKYSINWTTSVRHSFDSKQFLADHANEDFSIYEKTTEVRTFKVKESK